MAVDFEPLSSSAGGHAPKKHIFNHLYFGCHISLKLVMTDFI